jgi:hypothetical protein
MATSDAAVTKQSVDKPERCKYRHNWEQVTGEHPIPYKQIKCAICGALPKAKEMQEAEAIVHLRSVLKPGDIVYTVLRHVSRSGMSRNIDLYYMAIEGGPCVAGHNNGMYARPVWISGYVGHAIGSPQSRKNWERSQGLTVGGCGMDMGFHLVYSLGRVLFPDGFKVTGRGRNGDTSGHDKDGGYGLEHKWL